MQSEIDIFKHRAYRQVELSFAKTALLSTLMAGFFIFITLLAYPSLTLLMQNLAASAIVQDSLAPSNIFLPHISSQWQSLSLIKPGLEDSQSLHVLLISAFAFISSFASFKYLSKGGLLLWIFSASLLLLCSSLIYYLFPNSIPYSVGEFADLYFFSEWLIWISTPFFIAFSLIPVPCNALPKLSVILTAQIYSILIGILRFVLFLFIIIKGSFLFMPFLFFLFGPLLDVYIVVALLGIFTSNFKLETAKL